MFSVEYPFETGLSSKLPELGWGYFSISSEFNRWEKEPDLTLEFLADDPMNLWSPVFHQRLPCARRCPSRRTRAAEPERQNEDSFRWRQQSLNP
jgi:hypothetical protein